MVFEASEKIFIQHKKTLDIKKFAFYLKIGRVIGGGKWFNGKRLMFTGRYKYKMDNKNRVFIPQRLRKIDKGKSYDGFILLFGPAGSLILTTHELFEECQQELMVFPDNPRLRIEFKRYYISTNIELELDTQGRILIPQEYLEFAGIKKDSEVLFIGMGNWIELWNPEQFERRKAQLKLDWDNMAEEFLEALDRVRKNNDSNPSQSSTSGV